ncbi:hypothetical protein XBP1_1640006 [Xenorhabdus bovienii str. puntauvense]|uniref:Uncharacterized protein n=1 Tax=Xenorhabdus bovienii str. puntauvense TaxID=1398201 RepID=A0A077ND53_XENBV|nr:hypothetical protein XBP1_1640006 [Xenorhabdus bovienii str. puntauvense]
MVCHTETYSVGCSNTYSELGTSRFVKERILHLSLAVCFDMLI